MTADRGVVPVEHASNATRANPASTLTLALASPGRAGGEGWHVRHFATAFACVDAEAGEQVVGSLVSQALKEGRVADAGFWRHVRLHTRMVRAVPRWADRLVAPSAEE